FEAPGDSAVHLGLAALSVLYVGGLLGSMVQLRLLTVGDGAAPSLLPLASLIGAVKLSDSMQYFVGKAFGKRKLAPKLSPGKTWEGTIGGIALASLATALWLPVGVAGEAVFSTQRSLASLVFAVTVSVAGLVGDLAESLLKRDSGVKDSSDWMPGFGGVLDLLDSLLFASPVALLFWASGWLAS
ncbi:MAG: CDP-archaeol synthase, partial [Planctomycetota bacterium]